jgi:hypothetical protein
MKTLILLSLIITLCISCTKEPIETTNPGNVKISIDYTFPTNSGSMVTKSNPIYLDFYTKYIASKLLTPKTYSITFGGLNKNVVGRVRGVWGAKQLVAFPPDRYVISGTSWPTKYNICGDTCSLKFCDTIDITQLTTNITLKAYYDCSLILVDTTNVKNTNYVISKAWNYIVPFVDAVKSTMMKTDNFYYTFYNGDAMEGCSPKNNINLNVYSRQIDQIGTPYDPTAIIFKATTILLWFYTWEAGKYYYFGDSNGSYNLQPMTNGEQ